MAKRVLIVKAGTAAAPLRLAAGDYDRWFREALGGTGVRFEVTRPYLGEPLPRSPKGQDAILISGSPLSLTAPEPWMARARAFVREAAEARVPTLGICFGHQLLGAAFGARVVKNPLGREVGSVQVELTASGRKDPLFLGIPERFPVQATHEDVIEGLPEGATPLAGNANTPLQALAFGPACRSVQFHPELSPAGMRALLETRKEALGREAARYGMSAAQRVTRLLAGVQHTPHGARVLRNFLRHWT